MSDKKIDRMGARAGKYLDENDNLHWENTEHADIKNALDTLLNSQDTDNNLSVKQSGRYVALENGDLVAKDEPEIRLLSTDAKPDASTVELYQIALEMDTGNMYYSDGTNWVVFD